MRPAASRLSILCTGETDTLIGINLAGAYNILLVCRREGRWLVARSGVLPGLGCACAEQALTRVPE